MADTTPAPLTPAQADAARAQLAAFDAAQAQKAAADRATKLKPLSDLLASDAWTGLRAQISAAAAASIGEPFYDQVRALDMISGNLEQQVNAVLPQPPVAA